jgi:integrase
MMKAIGAYLALRRSLGYRLVDAGRVLKRFAEHSEGRGESSIRARTAVEWAGRARSARERWNRLRTIARFARHVHAEDHRHEIPPDKVYPHRLVRRVPYIFRLEEIRRLLEETISLGPRRTLRPHTLYTLFGLIAATGLRITEALRLTFDDLQPDGLIIRETKYKKSRLVPLHPSTKAALVRYLKRRRRFPSADRHVFISHRGAALPYRTVHHVFRKLLKRAGIRRESGCRAIVIHDFRHYAERRIMPSASRGRRLLSAGTRFSA